MRPDGTRQAALSPRLTAAGHRIVHGVGYPIHIDPRVGGLSIQVRPAPRCNVSKNLLDHHPLWRQEHPGTNEKAMEAPTDLDELIFLAWGLVGHVIYPRV
jgi:hypothetical protein